jgi:hypothetical protein
MFGFHLFAHLVFISIQEMSKSTIEYVGPHRTNMWFHRFDKKFTKEMGKRWARDGFVTFLIWEIQSLFF